MFGALAPQFKITDWIAGEFSPLTGTGLPINWEQYLPLVEYQRFKWGDSMACDYFSYLNCIELLYKYRTGLERNFSDRWLAKLGGNTKNGSFMEQACDTAIKYGLVDENVWSSESENWDDYYKEIPQEIIDKGKEFLNDWLLYREWVIVTPEKIKEALYDAPLQVFVKYAEGSGILSPVGKCNHFIMIYGMNEGRSWKVFDHYTQTKKEYAWDYDFGAVLKPTLLKKTNNIMTIQNNTLCQLVQGKGDFGLFLDNKIIIDDLDKVIATWLVRTNGETKGMVKALTLEDWSKFEKCDLKGNKI